MTIITIPISISFAVMTIITIPIFILLSDISIIIITIMIVMILPIVMIGVKLTYPGYTRGHNPSTDSDEPPSMSQVPCTMLQACVCLHVGLSENRVPHIPMDYQ